jgi:hypothetical protein
MAERGASTMRRVRWTVTVAALVAALAGCQTMPPAPPEGVAVPDLRGTWTGTWGNGPATLVIRDQASVHGARGLYAGPWQILGETRPNVSGILTFTLRGEPVSTSMEGWLGYSGGLRLVVEATAPSGGRQELVLDVDDGRLTGTGTSTFRWAPQGAVALTRLTSPAD